MTALRPLTRIAIEASSAAHHIDVETHRTHAAAAADRLVLPAVEEIGEVRRAIAIAILRIMRVLPRLDAPARPVVGTVLSNLAGLLLQGGDLLLAEPSENPDRGVAGETQPAAVTPPWWNK